MEKRLGEYLIDLRTAIAKIRNTKADVVVTQEKDLALIRVVACMDYTVFVPMRKFLFRRVFRKACKALYSGGYDTLALAESVCMETRSSWWVGKFTRRYTVEVSFSVIGPIDAGVPGMELFHVWHGYSAKQGSESWETSMFDLNDV